MGDFQADTRRAGLCSSNIGRGWGTARGAGLEVFEVAGTIKWFDASKGFGFIVPDNGLGDVLLHVTCLRAGGYQTAYEGARVHCQVLKTSKGLSGFRDFEYGRVYGHSSVAIAGTYSRNRAARKRLGTGHGKMVQPNSRIWVPYTWRKHTRYLRSYGNVAPVWFYRATTGADRPGTLGTW